MDVKTTKRKGLHVVGSFLLSESFGHESCLMSLNVALCVFFSLKDPLTSNGLYTVNQLDEIPDSVRGHSSHFDE